MSSSGSARAANSAVTAHEHAAVTAWLSIKASSVRPTAVTTIKERRRKSNIYRLHGALPDGSAVVAKRCLSDIAAIEHRIHKVVLPSLPVSRLNFFGACDVNESGMWLFMQDAGDIRFTADQYAIVARWLSLLHTTAADDASDLAANLPDRGLAHYRQRMQRSYLRLQALVGEWTTTERTGARALAAQAFALFDRLDARWATFARLADAMPPTLAHGDFVSKNMRVDDRSDGPAVYVFDWETAGWGSPAIDLACLGAHGHSVLVAYTSAVHSRWPAINAAAVEQTHRVGIVLRCIASIDWETYSLCWGQDLRRLYRLETHVARLCNALGPGVGLGLP